MLIYLNASDLAADPRLEHSMFADRARQFQGRLGWDVEVDALGQERDAYDALNPLYVIWKGADGLHKGSMRVLPTTGPCMTNDHFAHLSGGPITSPLIWESTRFCLSPTAGQQSGRISAALMLAACEIGLNFGLRHGIGVFDARMERVYARLGWPPDVLGGVGNGCARVSVGLWDFSDALRYRLALGAGVAPELSRLWFSRSFGTAMPQPTLASAG